MRIVVTDFDTEVCKRLEDALSRFTHWLPYWVNEIYIYRQPEDNGGASCRFDKRYRRMCLYVSGELVHSNIEDIEPVFAHEIAHAYNGDICMCLDTYMPTIIKEEGTFELTRAIFMERIEEQTQDLAFLFLDKTEARDG